MLGNVSFTLNRAHSIPPSIPQTPYNPLSFLVPTLILPIKWSSTKAQFLQEESLPNKRRIIKKEKKGKGARNKREKCETSSANTRAWKAPWKKRKRKREDENFKSSGRDLLKRKWKMETMFSL
jgi:hypothetical protein